MTSFLFATLGSVTFWVLYFVLSIFMLVIVTKTIAPRTHSYITGGERHRSYEYIDYTLLTIVNFIFWPFVMIGVICYFGGAKIGIPLLRKAFIAIDKLIPTIKFEKKEDKD